VRNIAKLCIPGFGDGEQKRGTGVKEQWVITKNVAFVVEMLVQSHIKCPLFMNVKFAEDL
jgi:hypothetical protein